MEELKEFQQILEVDKDVDWAWSDPNREFKILADKLKNIINNLEKSK